MSLNPHNYRRPEWRCAACGEEWPCEPRRAFWLEKYPPGNDRVKLRMVLGTIQLDAEKDLNAASWELQERFIEWTFTDAEREIMVWPEDIRTDAVVSTGEFPAEGM